MGGTETLLAPAGERRESAGSGCPRCAEPCGTVPPVVTSLFDEAPLRRCARCGIRYVSDAESSRPIVCCADCGLPFASGDPEHDTTARCEDCREGRIPADLADPALVAATEGEVRAVLAGALSCVSSPSLEEYLNRLTRQVTRRVDGAPGTSRVFLIDDESLETLTLPSGTVVMSIGMLASIDDEAELVFVLAHELCHAATGDAAVRLVRIGLREMARDTDAPGLEAWARAALDLVKLGYGRDQELAADAGAFEATTRMGYDPESAIRFLQRLGRRTVEGDPRVKEHALAHPAPAERVRALERRLFGRVAGRTRGRVNRELFRRAAGERVLRHELEPVDGLALDPASTGVDGGGISWGRVLIAAGAGTSLVLLIYWLWLSL